MIFRPPTFDAVAWERGVTPVNRGGLRVEMPADPIWGNFARGDRGRTVLRIDGEYRTVTTPTQTLIATADTISFSDGTQGLAVFMGGHEIEVTDEIADELVAAGYEVEAT